MLNIDRFIQQNNLTLTSKRIDSNPWMTNKNPSTALFHWESILSNGQQNSPFYSSTLAYEPDLKNLIASVWIYAGEADLAGSFRSWLMVYGWDGKRDKTQMRQIYETYREVGRRFAFVVGIKKYHDFINTEERWAGNQSYKSWKTERESEPANAECNSSSPTGPNGGAVRIVKRSIKHGTYLEILPVAARHVKDTKKEKYNGGYA